MAHQRLSLKTPRYAELRCKTSFSFLCGASHADELVARAAELGYAALAITDQNTLAGVVRAHMAAKPTGLKLLIGAEITLEDAPPVLLYAPDLEAYGRLARLITRGCRAAEKGSCRLHLRDLAEHADGLLAAVIPSSVGRISESVQTIRTDSEIRPTEVPPFESLSLYRDIFGDRSYLAAELHRGPNDEARLERLIHLAKQVRLPLVATNDVHYHDPSRRPLQDVLTAIRYGVTVSELGALRFPNAERHLKAPIQIAELFARCPEALANGLELAERCTFTLDELRYQYPEELCPPGLTPIEHLTRLSWDGARARYPDGVPDKVAALVRRELVLIEELRYEAFFLTVWDLVQFARGRGILCQGRGSAANSAVCFCLGITSVDPDRTDLLFERFVSRERDEAPDIDVDFEHERREEVLQYVYQKYGRDRAGIAAEVICYRPRSAVRDVGKALGLSLDRVDRLAKALDQYGGEADLEARLAEAGLDARSPQTIQLLQLAGEILGFPRHLSQHVGGFVITRGPLSELVPIENAAMPDRTMIEWDKDDLDSLGILKVDCLALGMLTAIRKCFDLIEAHYGRSLTLATIPAEDPVVYDMICRADTAGVFQIESRAQMGMLPRLKPRCFYDLVIEVAIVRPGPIQGNMIHPYLRRRNGEEPVTYPDPAVEQVLSKTLGVPLFQEQAMRLAMVAAGFTPGEADQLRRAMGAWRRPGIIEKFRTRLRDGMLARGLPLDFAEQIFEQIRGFGEYGFPEAHAASFALLAYISAWLKCHYPVAFAAALLNSQPMGFYAPAQIVSDLKSHDGTVHPVDINHSDWDCTLDGAACGVAAPCFAASGSYGLRLGFRLIKGLPQTAAEAIVEARRAGRFRSVQDVARRAGLSRPLLARLAAADAFGSLDLDRRTALWQVLSAGEELPLFAELDDEEESPTLMGMPLSEQVAADYDAVGLSLKAHPIGLLRPALNALGVVPASALADVSDKAVVQVAGLAIVRQHPSTAKGTVFVTLEDETGTTNLVLWPHIWKRFRAVARSAVALRVEGKLERSSGVIHIIASRLEDLSSSLRKLKVKSHDFH
jgi:error-prone DNA polymerase